MRAEIVKYQQEKANAVREDLEKQLSQNPILVAQLNDDINQLKDAIMQLRSEHKDAIIILGSVCGGKPSLMVALGDDIVAKGKNAGQIVRAAGKEIMGGGGGQPHFARIPEIHGLNGIHSE